MELFDIIEFKSYVSPLSERRRHQASGADRNFHTLEAETHREGTETPKPSVARTSHHPYWKLGAGHFSGAPEDMTIISVDFVNFHVHQACLLAASSNLFNTFLSVGLAGLFLQGSSEEAGGTTSTA